MPGLESAESKVTQYRIPMTVSSVNQKREVVGGHKDEHGRTELVYGPPLWYVHFHNSSEALCFGQDRPNLTDGEQVDVIIRKRA